MLKTSFEDLLVQLPKPGNAKWKDGVWDADWLSVKAGDAMLGAAE